eukprot:PLAT5465.1.p2 GENE.PLAT5465.1~~PLAT5465.1.p2  ORF type:complete len:574 (+),score=342.39 PLAT5465.1:47-1768(+)
MVVLSAAVTTKAGKPLVARQFVKMARMRVEGLLAAFPKLIGTGKQHTFVETESVRYVYQPLESLYLLLVTNKGSNIIEDLETLRLMSKILPEYCGSLSEAAVSSAAFELIYAFDEVISLGYKEAVTLSQIRTNTAWDSHEEKLHVMIRESKMLEAKEEMKRKAAHIREEKKRAERSGMDAMGGGYGGGSDSIGIDKYGMGPTSSSSSGFGSDSYSEGKEASSSGGIGSSTYSSSSSAASRAAGSGGSGSSSSGSSGGGGGIASGGGMSLTGMKLGGSAAKGMDFLSAMREDGIDYDASSGGGGVGGSGDAAADEAAAAAAAAAAASAAAAVPVRPVMLRAEEKMAVHMNREGGLEEMDVRGSLTVTATQESTRRSVVTVRRGENAGFQFLTHPHIDKKGFLRDSVIALKAKGRSFPLGTPVGVLKWRWSPKGEEDVPLTINCWPEESSPGRFNVNIEYTLEREGMELHDVVITIPLGSSEKPQIVTVDGLYTHNAREGTLEWQIDTLDASNDTGTLEFNIATSDADAFFPLSLNFTSVATCCDIGVVSVTDSEGSATAYGLTTALEVASYVIS